MYIVFMLLALLFLIGVIGCLIGFFIAMFRYDNPSVGLWLFLTTLVLVFPMLSMAYLSAENTEQDLVVRESGRITKVYKNVHNVDMDNSVASFTMRDGHVKSIITGSNRDIDLTNLHQYKK